MNKLVYLILITFLVIYGSLYSEAQNKLYPNEFPLADVRLLDGPFKHARDLNIEVLLKYDVDRLLAPVYPKRQRAIPTGKALMVMSVVITCRQWQ